jgi:hypothetical protein
VEIFAMVCVNFMYVGHTAVSTGATKLPLPNQEFIIYNPLYNPKTEKSRVFLNREALTNTPV